MHPNIGVVVFYILYLSIVLFTFALLEMNVHTCKPCSLNLKFKQNATCLKKRKHQCIHLS